MKLNALIVVVSERGRTAFGILVSEKCSDICAETLDTGFRDHIQCLPQTPPFFDWLVVNDE